MSAPPRKPLPVITEKPAWSLALLRPNHSRTWGEPAAYLKESLRDARTTARYAFAPALIVFALTATASTLLFAGVIGEPIQPTPEGLVFALAATMLITALVAVLGGGLDNYRRGRNAIGRLKAGIRGEHRTANTLERLPGTYHVIHGVDITAPDGGAEDIDHLVIGPSGIIMVDAKEWAGAITIDEHGLWRDGVLDTSLIEGTKRRAQTLAQYLGYSDGIRAVVCFTNPKALRRSEHRHGIDFVTLEDLVSVLRKNEGRLPEHAISELAEDAAILSPSATTHQPCRHTHIAIFPQHLRAYRLRHVKPAVTLSRYAMIPIAPGAFFVGAYHVFAGAMTPNGHTLLYGGLLITLATLAAMAFAILGRIQAKLTYTPHAAREPFTAPRASNRMDRIHPPIPIAISDRTPGTPEPAHDTRPPAVRTRDEIEAAFNRELILPATTLEQLVITQSLLTRADEYRSEWGQDLPYGVILHGPPGTGKTQIARIMASVGGFTFLNAKPADLRDKYVGESAKRIAALYQHARASAPAVVFLDEIDAIASRRDASGGDSAGQESNHALNQLLQEIDGFEKSHEHTVFTIGATNRLDSLDDAIRSRLSYRILVDLPDHDARQRMWRLFAKPYLHKLDVPLDELADLTHGLSGRDIRQVAKLASQTAFGRGAERVTRDMITNALQYVATDAN